MASASLAGLAVLLGLTQSLSADVRYHLVWLLPDYPDIAFQVTNTGAVLQLNRTILEPARDALGNPVWDSDGDGVADGYETRWLTTGDYAEARAYRIDEHLGLAVGDAPPWTGSDAGRPVLWTNIGTANPDGTFGTLIDLGTSHGLQYGWAQDVNSRGQAGAGLRRLR